MREHLVPRFVIAWHWLLCSGRGSTFFLGSGAQTPQLPPSLEQCLQLEQLLQAVQFLSPVHRLASTGDTRATSKHVSRMSSERIHSYSNVTAEFLTRTTLKLTPSGQDCDPSGTKLAR